MPWRKRRRRIPESCADLDLEAAGRDLIRAGGNVRLARLACRRGTSVFSSTLGRSFWTRRWRLRRGWSRRPRRCCSRRSGATTCGCGLGRLAFTCAPLRPAGGEAFDERTRYRGWPSSRRHPWRASSTRRAEFPSQGFGSRVSSQRRRSPRWSATWIRPRSARPPRAEPLWGERRALAVDGLSAKGDRAGSVV